MAEKIYKTDGETFNLKAVVNRVKWLKMKAIAAVKRLTKDQAINEAIQDWNEKHKGEL